MHTPEKKYATPSTTTNLLELPAEILIKIALMAGFRAATPLMKAHSRFARLLSDPRSWHSYTADPSSSSDVVEAHVTVTSKIHTFDHLVFGLWHQEQQTAASKNDTDRIREAHGDDQHVYVEHFTFSEAYDFLGGVELGLSRAGAVVTRFFDHRETLPCYKRALVTAVADGVLPPTAPSGEPPAGAKIDHACRDCAAYSRRTVLKSVFVFDEVPYNPRWGRDGFSWTYEFPDNRRRLRVGIKPYEGSIGYSNVRDLPGVFVSRVLVNGVELVGEEWALFQRVVQRKDC
ncbi:hypothetical protein HDU84_007913 [Entophlyctis sp. JEL0112]|nr:hypothetical protein HDU84_007913 [Entophlyctis sp. JEL0112]